MVHSVKKIVVVGGGAGGSELATYLGKKLHRQHLAEVILVDRNKDHLWKPLLHEIASGSLDDDFNAINFFAHSHKHHYLFQLGTLTDIDRQSKTIKLAEINDAEGNLLVAARKLAYDILVIAIGSISNDFGTPGIRENCLFLDSSEQAISLNHKLLEQLIKCAHRTEIKHPDINVAIVGGGATGVELSAELYNAIKQLQYYDIQNLNEKSLKITLLEASDSILPTLPTKIAEAARQELTRLGVKVKEKTRIIRADETGFYTADNALIKADLMIWSAGIKAPDFMAKLDGLETNKSNQLTLMATLQTTRDPNIFAIGDCAFLIQANGKPVPPRGQAAHQMASHCGKNILARLNDKPLKSFTYQDHGSLISFAKFTTMGYLGDGTLQIHGKMARLMYAALYRFHQIALLGYMRTGLMMLIGGLKRTVRPRLKLQ